MKGKQGDHRRQAEQLLFEASDNLSFFNSPEAGQLFQDLQVHQIELELQNEELRSAQGELENARMRYSFLYHNAPVGYVVLDGNGIIRQTNATFTRMAGDTERSLPGSAFTDFLHGEDERIFRARYKSFFRNPTGKSIEVRLINATGAVSHVRLEAAPHRHPKDEVAPDELLMTVSDITSRKEAETKLAHLNRVMSAVRKVHQLIIHEKDPRLLLAGACRMLTQPQGFYNAWIARLSEDGSAVVETIGSEMANGRSSVPSIVAEGTISDCIRQALDTDELSVRQTFDPACSDCVMLERCGAWAQLTRKLVYRDKMYGVISVSIPEVHVNDEESLILFKEVADDLAFALHNIETDEERRRLYHMVTTTSQPMALVSRSYAFLAVNDVFSDLFCMTKTAVIQRGVPDLVGDTAFETSFKPHLDRCFGGRRVQYETEVTFPAKGSRWLEIALTPYRDDRGAIIGAVFHAFDITERKGMEQHIRDSEEEKNLILNSTAELVAYYDTDLKLIWCNQAMERYAPESTGALKGIGCCDIWHTGDGICRRCPIVTARNLKAPQAGELETPDGRHWQIRAYPIMEETGLLIGVVGFARETTEQKRAEAERERLLAAVEQAAEAFVITDTDGTIQYVNPAFEHITGYAKSEAEGSNCRIVKSHAQDRGFYEEMWSTLLKGDVWRGDIVNRRKDGTTYTEETIISPVRAPNGETVNYVAVKRDITKEKKLEQQLRQAEKMEAIGHLAGGIAHDFNNILSGIIGYADLARDTLGEASPISADLAQILKAADRAKHLVGQILAFSRQSKELKKVIDAGPVTLEATQLLRATLPSSIRITSAISDNLRPIMADPTRIHEIIMNLCTNAAHSIGEKGTISVSLETRIFDDRIEGRLGDSPPGRYLVLKVTDDGRGMTPHTMMHIFEPFYSEKGVGKGTGMGLAVVFGIVQSHQGNICVESAVDSGTTFRVYLPTVTTPSVEAGPIDTEVPTGTEHILFVDDEKMLNTLFRNLLTGLGYAVTAHTDSYKALTRFMADPNSFDIVITDQTMPTLTGLELSKEILRIRPDIPIILCTGYSTFVDEKIALSAGIRAFCLKPLRKKDIAWTIRSLLDACPKRPGGRPAKREGRCDHRGAGFGDPAG